MIKLSYQEIDEVLRAKESYFQGLKKTGSNHDKKVSFYGLSLTKSLRADFRKEISNKSRYS
jgi:hypothetical protein